MRRALALALLLCSCTTIDAGNRVNSWPELKVRVHEVEGWELHQHCASTVSVFDMALGCAWIDLNARTCDIYISSPPQDFVLQHELAHCAGMEHPGEDTLHKMYANWKASHK